MTTETVTLHIRQQRQRVCIDGVETRHLLRRAVQLGETLPIFAGPTGKVMLAHLEPQEVDGILAWAYESGANEALIRSQLNQILELGYMASVGDRNPNVGGLSVPLFDSNGVVAAITVAGPGDRWDQEAMDAAAPRVVALCAEISAAMGGGRVFDIRQTKSEINA